MWKVAYCWLSKHSTWTHSELRLPKPGVPIAGRTRRREKAYPIVSVWICCPSARPIEEVAKWALAWRIYGYRIALWRPREDYDGIGVSWGTHDGTAGYPGYAVAVNRLVSLVIEQESDAEWFIAAGDDIWPDPNHTPEQIARECREHFAAHGPAERFNNLRECGTFGVMQPTGDRWADHQGVMAERVAGSAWIGREFAKRVNRGNGPLWHEYFHYCVDEELQHVATKLGVFWQRQDIVQRHEHYMRSGDSVVAITVPDHLRKANQDFMNARRKFATRLANRFPGSECL